MIPRRYVPILLGTLSILGVLLLWHLAGVANLLTNASSVPPLSSVLQAARSWFAEGFVRHDLVATLLRVVPGILIGSTVGVLVGLATGRAKIVYYLLGPHLHIWRALPAVAVVPLFLLILGVNETTRIFIVSLGVFFPVWVNTHEGASQVDVKFLEVARDMEFAPAQVYRRVIFPATLPFIIAGIRAGIGLAYIMVFIAEWIGANKGIGYRLSVAHTVLRTDHMVFGLIVLGGLAYATDLLYRVTVKSLFPWTEKNRG
jgi:ABC-type nitrate/sulfonate/bicarbonate transport system permease component